MEHQWCHHACAWGPLGTTGARPPTRVVVGALQAFPLSLCDLKRPKQPNQPQGSAGRGQPSALEEWWAFGLRPPFSARPDACRARENQFEAPPGASEASRHNLCRARGVCASVALPTGALDASIKATAREPAATTLTVLPQAATATATATANRHRRPPRLAPTTLPLPPSRPSLPRWAPSRPPSAPPRRRPQTTPRPAATRAARARAASPSSAPVTSCCPGAGSSRPRTSARRRTPSAPRCACKPAPPALPQRPVLSLALPAPDAAPPPPPPPSTGGGRCQGRQGDGGAGHQVGWVGGWVDEVGRWAIGVIRHPCTTNTTHPAPSPLPPAQRQAGEEAARGGRRGGGQGRRGRQGH